MSEFDKYFGDGNMVMKRLDVLDRSLINDLQVLFDHQRDTLAILDNMSKSMDNMITILEKTTVKAPRKGKSLLFWGGVAVLGYAAYKYTEPKKGNANG